MARKLIVEVVGDSRSLERTFARSTSASRKFGTDMNSSLGKAEARFTKFQRVAAGGFIGGALAATGISALKRIIDVSAESQQVLGQTKVALEATGKSWEAYGKQIEDTVQKQSRLGFDDEALLRTFSLFQRTTGDVNKALTLNNLAMDVARARFIDLEQAATLVNKAALGQAGALRRLGIDAKTGADATELLTLLTEKYGGSAQAASNDARTSMDRVNVAVENLQESIGTLLLPGVEALADVLTTAAEEAQALVEGLNAVADVQIPTIKLPFEITIGGQSIGDLAGRAFNVIKVTGPAAPIMIPKLIADVIAKQFDEGASTATPELANSFARSINTMTQNALDTAAAQTKPAKPPAFGQPGFKPINTDGKTILGALDAAISVAKQAATKAATEAKAELDAENRAKAAEAATERHRKALERLAEERRKRAQLAEKMRRQAAEELQAGQFRALGLAPTGADLVPGVANLKKQLSQLTSRLGDDASPKIASQLTRIGKVLSGKFGDVTEETRSKIRDMFAAIRAELQKGADGLAQGPLTKTAGLNTKKLLEGLGLTPEVASELRGRLSGFNTAGLALASGGNVPTGGFAGAPVVVESHTTIQLDGHTVAKSVTRQQQKRKRRNPAQVRGPNRNI